MNTHLRNRRSGFTLVELMVVAIIVAILAAVAIPLMSGNTKRAVGTEAETALSMIRTQLRVMYAETGKYNLTPGNVTLTTSSSITNIPGVIASDVNGRYWASSCYTINAIDATSFTLKATGVTNEVSGLSITMTDGGIIARSGF
jgi:prepilin-type N-terminal cleavage/methylation domain-containing protein